MDWASMISVGRIARPHGIRGDVVVDTDTDFGDERFAAGAVLRTLRDGQVVDMTVTEGRPHQGRWLVRFEGTASMNEAELLRGLELRIPADTVQALQVGQYYVHDLAGCTVQTTGGVDVGEVTRVELGPGMPLLVVGAGAGEVLVPFVDAICRRIDLTARLIVIDPPEGLIDLNRVVSRNPTGDPARGRSGGL